MIQKLLAAILIMLISSSVIYAQPSWTQKASFGGGAVTEARAFAIGNFGYFGGPTANLWRYDALSDTWAQMAAFPAPTRLSPVAFSIGSKGYMGTGGNYNDFYEYDALANTWVPKANFGGSGREGAVGIAIDGKGYIGTGGSYLNDWWEFDPATNAWTQKANLTGPTRYHGGAFAIGSKGYVSTGFNGAFFNDLWEFDPVLNSWTAKSSLPAVTRDRPVGLGTATKGYILTGWTGNVALNDAWEYDPLTDSWVQLPSMPTAGRYNACGFTIADKLYIGTGYASGNVSDFWEFGPDCVSQASPQAASCGGSCDGSAAISVPAPGAVVSYLWSDGQTTPVAQNLCAGSYVVTVTDTSGCVSVTSFIITEPDPVTATAAITQPGCFGDSSGVLCAIPNTGPVTFLWANGDTSSCLQNISAGVYTVTVTDSSGCSGTVPLTLTQPGAIDINFNHTDATCLTCPNGSASAQTSGGTAPLTYGWSNGSSLAFINNLLPGVYTCCVTDANGCTHCDSVEIAYPVGISDMESLSVAVGPNPFDDFIMIDIPSYSSQMMVKIYDISGRLLSSKSIRSSKSIKINTAHIQSGIYFLELSFDNEKSTYKLLKQ